MNKKDLLKKMLIEKDLNTLKEYAKIIPLKDYNINYSIVIDDLFYIAKINNLVSYNFFLDRTFYNKLDFTKSLASNLSWVTDLWNNEYQLTLNWLLDTIKDYLWKNGWKWIEIFEIQFKKEDLSQKIYKTIFLLKDETNNFSIIDLKKNNDQNLLSNIKQVVQKDIIEKYWIIKNWHSLLNPITKVSQYEDLLLSQVPDIIKNEFDTYNYPELYKNISLDFFLQTSFVEENYINTHWLDELFKWIKDWKRIVIYGDYDSDWFNSAFQLHKLFKAIGYNNFVIIFPTREKNYINVIDWKEMTSDFTWYWITKEITWFINNNDLLITVDNGWAQVDVFKHLLEKWINIPVIIIDHHNLTYSNWTDKDDHYRLEELFIREAWIKLNEIDTQKIVLLKKDFPVYYNHPYIKAEFNWIAATIMTWLFILEFLKRYNNELWLENRYKSLLENLILHAWIWQITDVMSLLPTTKNVWLLIYILAKKTFQKSLNDVETKLKEKWVTELSGEKLLTFNAQYSRLSSNKKDSIRDVIKEMLFMPYQLDQEWRIFYTNFNKEVLLLMYSKKVGVFSVGNIGWMVWPLINIIWRTSSLSELMEYLTYITEDQSDYKTKLPVIANFTKIMEVTTIRRETVNEWKRLLSKFIEVYTNIDSDDFLYLPEDYLKILFLTNLEEFNFKNYNNLQELYLKLRDKGVIWDKKWLYGVADKYGLSKEQIRLFNKWIINFISPFNWLVASKISEAYNINSVVASSVTKRYNNGLSFHWSWRWIGNINLNQFIQDIKDNLKQHNIEINWGGHAGAVWLWIDIGMKERVFSYGELLDKYYLIEDIIKQYMYNIAWIDINRGAINNTNKIISFYKPIIFRKVINMYRWAELPDFITKLYKLADRFGIFWSDFAWKSIYIPFDLWLKQIVENWQVKNYDNINYVIAWTKLYVNVYTKKIVKTALKEKNYKWLSENYQFVKINIVEDNSWISWFNYEVVS